MYTYVPKYVQAHVCSYTYVHMYSYGLVHTYLTYIHNVCISSCVTNTSSKVPYVSPCENHAKFPYLRNKHVPIALVIICYFRNTIFVFQMLCEACIASCVFRSMPSIEVSCVVMKWHDIKAKLLSLLQYVDTYLHTVYVTGPMKINHVSANYIELYFCQYLLF